MPELTRKRVNDQPVSWHIYYAGVHVGTIAERSGNPRDTDRWRWDCGFYPGSGPGEQRVGTAATFEEARARFEEAWREYLPKRTEADFQEWRDDRDWTAHKYALWDAGKQLPPNEWEPGKPCSYYLKCPCGEIFNSHRLEQTLVHVPHITAAQSSRQAGG